MNTIEVDIAVIEMELDGKAVFDRIEIERIKVDNGSVGIIGVRLPYVALVGHVHIFSAAGTRLLLDIITPVRIIPIGRTIDDRKFIDHTAVFQHGDRDMGFGAFALNAFYFLTCNKLLQGDRLYVRVASG